MHAGRRWLNAVALAAVLVVAALGAGGAGATSSRGTDFWLTFPTNYSATPALTLFIVGDTETSGTVSVPGLEFTTPFRVAPGAVTSISLPPEAQISNSDVVGNNGIHVSAAAPVTVYGLNRIQFTTDAYLGLPSDADGTDYIALGYNGSSGSEFGMVATQDGTVVTITPTQAVGEHPAGVPYVVTLNQGQTYEAIADELSGTVITSTKPIAVYGGNRCANIPPGYGACDHVVEQLPPTTAWGKNFVSMPLATRQNGDTFRILASQDGTTVTLNGKTLATLSRAQFTETIINGPAQITADKPVLVMQYSNGTSYDGVTSDPFQMMIPPYEQFLSSYTVSTPGSGFDINYINVVAPNAAVGAITLDGSAIAAGSFTAIGTSGFSGAQLAIPIGAHTLTGPLPFGVHTYGFASADSYGYPGGISTSEVARATTLTLSPRSQTGQVNTQQCVVASVNDQNGGPLPDIRVDYSVTGANPTRGSGLTGADGRATLCYTGAKAGDDTFTGTVGTLSDSVTVSWTTEAPTAPPPSAPAQADLSLSVSGPSYVRAGQQATFTIVVRNAGPDSSTGVAVKSAVSGPVTLVSSSSSSGNGCSGGTCEVGTLAAGASATVTLVYRATSTGSIGVASSVEGDHDSSAGNNSASTSTAVIAADAPPPPPPAPSQSGTFNAVDVGTVLVNGVQRPADQLFQLNSGDTIDVTNGILAFTTADGSTGLFSAAQPTAKRSTSSAARATADLPAQFVVSQSASGGTTTLTLSGGDFAGCGSKRSLAANQTPVRALWGSAKGNFQTKGRFSAATVRGTIWLTQDRCDGTLTQVVQGVVDVADSTLNKTVAVTSGQSYVAEAPTTGAFKPPATRQQTAAQVKRNGLRWAGHTYRTKAAFTRYLRAHGSTWTQFAKNYPRLAGALASRS